MEDQLDKYFTTLRRFSHVLMGKLLTDGSGPKLDLKFSQLRAMSAFKEDRAFTMKELADNGMIKLPNMTTMVDSLIKDGIAERQRDEEDRRKVFVRLTPKGKKLRDALLENKRRTAMSIFSRLTDENKEKLLAGLDDVCRILEETIEGDES